MVDESVHDIHLQKFKTLICLRNSVNHSNNISKRWKYLGWKYCHCISYEDSQSYRSYKKYPVLTALTMHSWQTHDFAKCVPFSLPIFLCVSQLLGEAVWQWRAEEGWWRQCDVPLLCSQAFSWWDWSKAVTTSAGMRATAMGAVLPYLCCSAHMSKTFVQLQDLMYPTITMHPEP